MERIEIEGATAEVVRASLCRLYALVGELAGRRTLDDGELATIEAKVMSEIPELAEQSGVRDVERATVGDYAEAILDNFCQDARGLREAFRRQVN